jgi:hypothetical protein
VGKRHFLSRTAKPDAGRWQIPSKGFAKAFASFAGWIMSSAPVMGKEGFPLFRVRDWMILLF